MATPSRVPLGRRGSIVTNFHGFGTTCLVPSSYYCTLPVCVPDVLGALAVWQHTKKTKKVPKPWKMVIDIPRREKEHEKEWPWQISAGSESVECEEG